MSNISAKILLVEDDDTLLEMYALKFKEVQLNLITAADGLAGLDLALKELPQVILLDIMMPKMDGFAVLVELRKNPKTKDTPILMLSNLGQESDIEKGKQLGADGYIVKASMTPAQIVDKIKSYLDK
ncbi:MAG: response regulator [Patescibacteria group bacterium]|jgi:DNA-binding response OmpR family regulator